MKRIFCDVVLLALLFYCPWYLAAAAIFAFAVIFPGYWEGVVAALIIDSFYSVSSLSFKGGFGMFTLPAMVLVYLSGIIRSKIRIFA